MRSPPCSTMSGSMSPRSWRCPSRGGVGPPPGGRRLPPVAQRRGGEPHEATDAKTAIALYCTRDLGLDPKDVDDACEEIAAHAQRVYPPGTVGHAYRVLLRLAQPWQTRYPLLETSGIIGDHHDDDPAGPEQGGVRTPHLAHPLFPLARAPLLPIGLLNGGADGDAVVPPHNLSELWTALEHVWQDPNESLDDLMEVLPGPDFPTGGGG